MTEEMTEDRAQQLLDAIAAVREALTGRNLTANDVIGVLVASITDGIDQLTRARSNLAKRNHRKR